MGENHWGAHALHTLEKRHCKSATRNTTEQAKRPRGRPARGGKGESVAAAQQGKHLAKARPNALLARGACHPAWSNCNMPLQQGSQAAESTEEVCPRRRALLRARQLVLRHGGCCCLGLAQPHHVPLPSHALSLLAKTTVACNVVEAPVVPAQRAAGVRLIGPFLQVHVVSIAWQLAAAPDTAQGPTPALSLPLDTCLKIHLRYAG
jgi:hypothetical protein